MEKLTEITRRLMEERFGKDSLMALATVSDGTPHVRTVDAFYEDGSFYVVTHAMSGKMQQIARNPSVALCGEWFTAHGMGESLGAMNGPGNAPLSARLKEAFSAWIDNGHSDPADENTVILRIRLTDGVLMSHGTRYEIDFEK